MKEGGVKSEQKEEKHGHLKLKTRFVVRKFADDEAHRGDRPYEVSEAQGNIGLNEGIAELLDLACGLGSPTAYNNANARVGVGNGTAAEAATQTALQGASTAFKAMDTSYPSRSSQTVSFRGTFGGSEANFAWEEFTVDNGATPNKNLVRKVSAQGTKTSGQTWELTIQVTMS